MNLNSVKNHYVALDSLRGICATFVVFCHFEGDAFLRRIPFIENGFLFVDFFFVLSGFVIAASYRDKLATGYPISKFMFLRAGRLYPLYLTMLLAFLVLAIAKGLFGVTSGLNYEAKGFFQNLFMVQIWAPYEAGFSDPWNAPGWSISAEMWAYILFAVVCRWTGGRYVVAFLAITSAAVPILLLSTDRYLRVEHGLEGFARCALSFSLGVLTYHLWSSTLIDKAIFVGRPILWTAVECSVCALALLMVATAGPVSMFCPLVFAITVFVFAASSGAISKILELRPFVFIGMLSFSIYLTHEFILARYINVIQAASKYIPLPVVTDISQPFGLYNASGWKAGSDLALITLYLGVVAVSFVTHRFIEAPWRERSRRLVARYRYAAATMPLAPLVARPKILEVKDGRGDQ